jgi:transposase-like protein
MKPSPSDKAEIIRLVEESHLPTRRTLEILGIPRSSFYRWYGSLPARRPGGYEGPAIAAGPYLEPYPEPDTRADHRDGVGLS